MAGHAVHVRLTKQAPHNSALGGPYFSMGSDSIKACMTAIAAGCSFQYTAQNCANMLSAAVTLLCHQDALV